MNNEIFSNELSMKGGSTIEYNPEMDKDVDYQFLLRKYGPEGLWLIAKKMQEVAMNDVRDGLELSLTLDMCYDNVLKTIKDNE